MSSDYMTLAWRTELQAGPRLVLLAICDNANDDGNCYPSIQALSNKSGLSVRAVRGHVAAMDEAGLLVRHERVGRSTYYQINLQALRAAVFKSLSARKDLSEYDRGILRSCTPETDTPADSAPRQILPTPTADSAPRQILPTPTADSAGGGGKKRQGGSAESAAITNKEPTTNQQLKKHNAGAIVGGDGGGSDGDGDGDGDGDPKPKPTDQKPQPQPFVLPDWIPADTWAAFMDTRKAKKARNTDYALGLIVKSLLRLQEAGHDPVEILDASIKAGWVDVYPPKPPIAPVAMPGRRAPAPEKFAARTYVGGKL